MDAPSSGTENSFYIYTYAEETIALFRQGAQLGHALKIRMPWFSPTACALVSPAAGFSLVARDTVTCRRDRHSDVYKLHGLILAAALSG